MKIIDKIASRERCAEAGWYAWDFILDQPMDDAFILSLRPLGSFVYLSMLSKPFFKIESVHEAYRDKLAEVEALVGQGKTE